MPAPSTSPITKTVSIVREIAGRRGVSSSPAAAGVVLAVVMSAAYPAAPGTEHRGGLGAGQDRVLVRVWRRAGAQQDERLRAVVDELVLGAGRDDDHVTRAHARLFAGQPHQAGTGGEEVDLLGAAMEVGLGRRTGRDARLRERLVDGVAAGDAGQLADLGAVEGDERLALLEAADLHG